MYVRRYGQKGPLVLPEPPTAEEVTPSDAQTEDEEESDQSPR